jgi:hypothetical protein
VGWEGGREGGLVVGREAGRVGWEGRRHVSTHDRRQTQEEAQALGLGFRV